MWEKSATSGILVRTPDQVSLLMLNIRTIIFFSQKKEKKAARYNNEDAPVNVAILCLKFL